MHDNFLSFTSKLFKPEGEDIIHQKRIRNVFDFSSEDQNKEYKIHQIDFFDHNDQNMKTKPKLLMIHGYGGTGAVFYQAVKHLRPHFRITTIDLLGMGASGRPQTFLPENCEECLDYFLLSMRAWMEQTNYDDEEYFLLGHSLGGHLSILYAILYPTNLRKLILASPVGVPHQPEGKDLDSMIE
jgi:cardiolipin-specific phospholipase